MSPATRTNILLLDDFTRSAANGLRHHAINRHWLRRLLAPGLAGVHDAADALVLRDWQHDAASEVADFMALLGLRPGPAGWAATSRIDPLPDQAAAWLDARLGAPDLVIGFELPLFLWRHLTARGIGCVDIAIDPVRFARDLFFRVRTNLPDIASRLAELEVDPDIPRTDAALLAAHALRAHPPVAEPACRRATVFFCQTQVDRALVQGGQLADPRDFVPAIARAAADNDALLICPHPAEPASPLARQLARLLPGSRVTSANAYALLASEQVANVLSLSSSVLAEASFFGKPARSLIVPDVDHPDLLAGLCSRWHRLDTVLLSAAFWRGTAVRGAPQPDALRNALGTSWARHLPLRPTPPSRWRRVAKAGFGVVLALVT